MKKNDVLGRETDNKIAQIVLETWDLERRDAIKNGESVKTLEHFEFNIYISYICSYGWDEKKVRAFAGIHGIEIDELDCDPDDEIKGALKINKKVEKKLMKEVK